MSDFFERLRTDAAPLRFEPDGAMMSRIAARVRERISQPTVAQLIAAWFRPLAASLAAVAILASVGLVFASDNSSSDDQQQFASSNYEISMAGSDLSVGN
ncbi:MAG TPA: hypothetical protein VMU84_20785 [Thermoanaerobaculia bacterium]|nr:hypothetical protein [Thermoanaerobaculia bacterium]